MALRATRVIWMAGGKEENWFSGFLAMAKGNLNWMPVVKSLLALPAAPFRPRPFELHANCSLPARMRYEPHACHPRSSCSHGTQGDRPLSWLLPAPQYGQIPGQAG